MTWFPRRAGLACHDLDAGAHFFGTLLGLGAATVVDAATRDIGTGLRLRRPDRVLAQGARMARRCSAASGRGTWR